MPYKDREKQREKMKEVMRKRRGITEGITEQGITESGITEDRPFPKIGEKLWHPDGRFAGKYGVDRDDLSRFNLVRH